MRRRRGERTDKNWRPSRLLIESTSARQHANLVLACLFISGFNQLSGMVSRRPGDRPMGSFDERMTRQRQRRGLTSVFRGRAWVLFVRALAVTALLAAPHLAFASGEERTTGGDDMTIRTDTRWAGGSLGGYLPVRVEIANHAPARKLVFEVTPADRHGATVKRVVRVDQQATVRFTLSIPLTAFRQGTLRRFRLARRTAIACASRWGRDVPERRVDACHARGLAPARRLLGLP